jgi:hypothetical protein
VDTGSRNARGLRINRRGAEEKYSIRTLGMILDESLADLSVAAFLGCIEKKK